MDNYQKLREILDTFERLDGKNEIKEKLIGGINRSVFCTINNLLKDEEKSNEYKEELFDKGLIEFAKVDNFRDMKSYCEDIWEDFGKYNFRHRFTGFVSNSFVWYEDDWTLLGGSGRDLFHLLESYLKGIDSGIAIDKCDGSYDIGYNESYAFNVYPYSTGWANHWTNGLYIFTYIKSDHYQHRYTVKKFESLEMKIFVCEKFA